MTFTQVAAFRRRLLFVSLSAFLSISLTGWAQEDLRLWLNPQLNEFSWSIDEKTDHYADGDVAGQDTDVDLWRQDLGLRYRFDGGERSEWILSLDSAVWSVDSDARFDESGASLPDDFYDLSLGATYRWFLENDWLVGQNLQLGSAGDKPFDRISEMDLSGTTFLRFPSGKYNAWMVFLNFDTGREYPVIPGAAYQLVLSRRLWMVVGVPVASIGWRPLEPFEVQINYFPLNNLDASVAFHPTEQTRMSVGFYWDSRYFKRADREEWDDRIEFEEKRAQVNLEYTLNESVSLGAHGGFAFDRTIGEGNDADDRSANDIDIEDSWFGGVKLNWKW